MSENTYHQAPDALAGAPSGCPVHHGFSPLNDDYLDDPYPVANELRELHPIFYAEPIGHVVVTRMEDIEHVFTHPDVYASTNVQDPVFPLDPEAVEILGAADFDPVAVIQDITSPYSDRALPDSRDPTRGFIATPGEDEGAADRPGMCT